MSLRKQYGHSLLRISSGKELSTIHFYYFLKKNEFTLVSGGVVEEVQRLRRQDLGAVYGQCVKQR